MTFHIIYILQVTTVSLTGCVIWEYESLRAHASQILRKPSTWISIQQKKIMSQFVNILLTIHVYIYNW